MESLFGDGAMIRLLLAVVIKSMGRPAEKSNFNKASNVTDDCHHVVPEFF